VDGPLHIKSRTPSADWRSKLRYMMPMILPNSFAFRRELFDEHGTLDESLHYANDYDFLRRIVDAGARGVYAEGAWYYFQVGGLSQQRHYDCAREVARTAIRHGSSSVLTHFHFARRFLETKASFLLNRLRRSGGSPN